MQQSFLIKDYLGKNRRVFLLVTALGLLNSCVTFLLPVSLGNFFALYYHDPGTKSHLLHSLGIHIHHIGSFYLFFGSLLLIKLLTGIVQRSLATQQGERFAACCRETLFTAQMGWTEEQFMQKKYGNYLLRYSNDMKAIQQYLVKGIMEGWRSGLYLLLGIVLLGRIHWLIALSVGLALIALMIVMRLLWNRQKIQVASSRSQRSSLLAFVTRKFSRFSSIKAKQQEALANNGFVAQSQQLYRANMVVNQTESLLQAIVAVLPFLLMGLLLVLIVAGALQLDHSAALTAMLVLMLMQTPIKSLLKLPGIINRGKLSLQKLEDYIHPKAAVTEPQSL
jgi:ABC-type multidrug transport system fused ATPase/permease subunit